MLPRRIPVPVRLCAVAVVVLAVLPLIGLVVARALGERDHMVGAAETRALETANLLAERQGAILDEMRSLLSAVGEVGAVAVPQSQSCDGILARIVAGRSTPLGIGRFGADGRLACSSHGRSDTNISGDAAFREVMATDGPEEISTVVARSRLMASSAFLSMVPIRDAQGHRVGALAVSVPFGWIGSVGRLLGKQDNEPIFLIDAGTGEILARSINPEDWVGQRHPDHAVIRAYRRTRTAGTVLGLNPRGVGRIFGYAPLHLSSDREVLLAVSLTTADIVADAERRTRDAVVLALLIGLLGVVLAWSAAHLSLVRPIRTLSRATTSVSPAATSRERYATVWQPSELRLLSNRLDARDRQITEAHAALSASEANLRLVTENASDVIVRTDRSTSLLYVSGAVEAVLGCSPAEFRACDLLTDVHPDDALEARCALAGVVRMGSGTLAFRRRNAGGRWVWLEVIGRRAADGGFVFVMRDVTERREADHKLRHMTLHDGPTDLLNRVGLQVEFDKLSLGIRPGSGIAVACLDLDRFRQVNDAYGHTAGDTVLAATAQRLREVTSIWAATLGHAAFAARLGGDEFALVLTGGTRSQVEECVKQAIDEVSEPIWIGKQAVQVDASAGIATCSPQRYGIAELLHDACVALEHVKRHDPGRCACFDAEMDDGQRRRRDLEHDLRHAIGTDELYVSYQPICESAGRGVVGYEALLRWKHPVYGSVSPSEFIAIAEESGQILPLGLWVLRTACEAAASWPGQLRVSVNLSAAQFMQQDLVERVSAVLRSNSLPGTRLTLEITESMLVRDEAGARTTITRLKALGIAVALDDFGTGFSSLSYLHTLPFDVLKIDRSFVAELGRPKHDAIVEAILSLASTLGMDVVAEGVETEEQLARLRALKCPRVQGYLLGRPGEGPVVISSLHAAVKISA